MKITFAIVAAAFAASLALSQADAGNLTPAENGKTYLVQVNGATVAILPEDPSRTISVSADNVTYYKETGTMVCKGGVKLVANAPDQASITITGEDLTLLAQK